MNPGQHARPVIEALEPRILYSADLAPGLPAIGAGLPAAETRQLYPAAPGAAPTLTEIAFVDSSLADTDLLVQDLAAQRAGGRAIDVVLIGGDEDGIQRITQALSGRTQVGAIHLFGHGSGGELQLGAGQLDQAALFRSAGAIAGWSTAFTADADILLYGCDLAANESGIALVDGLAALTGADVAGSDDATGSPLQDADWVLEYQRGSIETDVALSTSAQQAWTTALATTQLSPIGDTYIDDGSQTLNYGLATSLVVDQSGPGIGSQRVLLQFDLNAIPAGATITNATLKLQSTATSGPASLSVYEVTQSWFQGVGNGDPAVVGASWDQRTFAAPWTTPGGTFNPTPVWTYATGGVPGQDTWNITALAQAWYAGTKVNYGLIIGSSGGGGDSVTYDSSEGATPPQLVITYTVANQAPVITSNGGGGSASVSVAENSTAVTTVTATDPDGTTPTYVLSGADAGRFTLNTTSGVLGFTSAPDFEAPLDANGDNVYQVTVAATDGSLSASQNLSITVTNLNDNAPLITSNGGAAATITVAENSSAVTTVTATDPDGTTPTYVLSGADAGRFTLNTTSGVLSFTTAPDFENKLDTNGDNVYQVTVSATDGTLSASQNLSITVTNLNEAPVITSSGGGASASIEVAENSTAVTTVTASDPDGTTPTYVITGGADSALFTIDGLSGALLFSAAPSFSAPLDSNGDNVYEVTIGATDGSLTDPQNLFVAVTLVNAPPVITSNGGGASTNLSVTENSSAVTTVTATDPNGTTPTYVLGGADAGHFTLNTTSGALSFAAAPDFENKLDANGDNVYQVTVSATDGSLSDSQALDITVTNLNEAPVITSGGGGASTSIDIAENSTAVTTVTAIDPDGSAPTYVLSGADAALFTLDPASGVLSFTSAPDFDNPLDGDGDNVYQITVSATDGSLGDSQDLNVSVQGPTPGAALWLSREGNATPGFTGLTSITGSQAVGLGGPGLTLGQGNTSGSFTPVFDIGAFAGSGAELEDLEYVNRDLTIGGTVLLRAGDVLFSTSNTETLTSVNSVVANKDDLVLFRPTTAGDYSAGTFAVIADNLGSALPLVPFNDLRGLALVEEATVVGGRALSPGTLLFTIDNESKTIYTLVPSVVSGNIVGGTAVPLLVGPEMGIDRRILGIELVSQPTTLGGVTLPAGSLLVSLDGDDVVADNNLTVSKSDVMLLELTGTSSLFSTASGTATLLVEGTSLAIPSGKLDGLALATAGAAVVNGPPVITSDGGGDNAAITIAENSTAVTTVTATDADGSTPTYVLGGADAARFTLNPTTGVLAFTTAPDFENRLDANGDNVYQVTVSATDGSLSDSQALGITVTNLNDNAPVITSNGGGDSAAITVAENSTAVTTVTATDTDGTIPTYVLGGADAAHFTLNPTTGVLAFTTAPDFENRLDANGDNVYQVTVSATDGSLSDSQALGITVTNVNDNAPVITSNGGGDSAAITVAENSTAVTTVTATDADGTTASYVIGGADAGRFTLNPATGVLAFTTAPDFENRLDANGDNVYQVTVSATDGSLSDSQALGITVTNVNDNAPVITVPPAQLVLVNTPRGIQGLVVADADAGNTDVQLKLSVSGGTLTVGTGGAGVPPGAITGNGTSSITLTGPVAQLNISLANGGGGLNYAPEADFSGAVTLTVLADDGGQPGPGPALTASGSVALNVVTGVPPVDLPPAPAAPAPRPPATVTGAGSTPAPAPGAGTPVETGVSPQPGGTADEASGIFGGDLPPGLEAIGTGTAGASSTGQDGLSAAVRKGQGSASAVPEAFAIPQMFGTTLLAPGDLAAALERVDFVGQLDALRRSADAPAVFQKQVAGFSTAASMSLTAGYVLWLLRGGALLASMVSSLPAWHLVDPLPVLRNAAEDDGEAGDDDDEVENVFGAGTGDDLPEPDGPAMPTAEPPGMEPRGTGP